MKLEIGDYATVEFDMSLFQNSSQRIPVHVYARDGERYELLELNRTIIRSVRSYAKSATINVALLTIYRSSKFKYQVSPGTLVITKEKGRFPLQ